MPPASRTLPRRSCGVPGRRYFSAVLAMRAYCQSKTLQGVGQWLSGTSAIPARWRGS